MITDTLTKPNIMSYTSGEGQEVKVLPLTSARQTQDQAKLNKRLSLVSEGIFPLVPTESFGLMNYECAFTLGEIRSGEYINDPELRAKNTKRLEEIVTINRNAPVIISAASGLFGDFNLMVVDPSKRQDCVTLPVLRIANSLAELGHVVAMNGYGNNSSKITLHVHSYDINNPNINSGITLRGDLQNNSISIEQASVVYSRLLAMGKLVSIAILGDGKVGFIEQRLPFAKEKIIHSRRALDTAPFPYEFSMRSLSVKERTDLMMMVKLGIGCFEAVTSNLVVHKLPELTIDQYLVYYNDFCNVIPAEVMKAVLQSK